MSIFKGNFTKEIKSSLITRQNAIKGRNRDSIIYLNTRNAWIKMSSSVNVYSKNTPNPTQKDLLDEKNYSDELARKYILKGGVLNPSNQLKSGVGGFDNAYSNIGVEGVYNRGIVPMPGISSINIKPKSAYGSLREVVVNFQCWDIKQLEDLELLYMRPGYSVLIEWGWTPYLDINGKLQPTISTYPFFNTIKPKEKIWEDLFNLSNNSGGNYDALFGIVKNYNWSARPDGGYDCSTTLISVGEIIESLKVNYTSISFNTNVGNIGVFKTNIDEYISKAYKKNKIAGIFSELYKRIKELNKDTVSLQLTKGNKRIDDLFFYRRDLNFENAPTTDTDKDNLVGDGADKINIYITLESLITVLNEFVLLSDGKNQTALVKLSTKERKYDKEDKTKEENLLCLTHPLQISIDPTVCYIKNQNWLSLKNSISKNTNPLSKTLEINKKVEEFLNIPIVPNVNYDSLIDQISDLVSKDLPGDNNEEKIISLLQNGVKVKNQQNWEELNRQCIIRKNSTLYDLIFGFVFGLNDEEIEKTVGKQFKEIIKSNIYADYKSKLIEQQGLKEDAAVQVDYLGNDNVQPFFFNDDPESGMGVIGNIYINLQYLYSLSLNDSLEGADKKEKQEINLYNFIKTTLTSISNSIGNINNFDIHVDPIDNNIGRIIDINYVDTTNKNQAYEDAFELELHSTKSPVRSYKFESKIFPEQTTIIAIGSQVKGGALGTETNTLVDFNKGIIDRIIPRKEEPNVQPNQESLIQEQYDNLLTPLNSIYEFLGNTTGLLSQYTSFDIQSTSKYSGALRDLIEYSKSFIEIYNKNSNKSIIPTILSFEMDGIGGLVIGHIFKIPNNLIPKGYKSYKGINKKIGYTITGIGHNIVNNDWVTNIESQFVILDEPTPVLPLNSSNKSLKPGSSSNIINSIDIIQGNIPLIQNVNYKFNPPKSSSTSPVSKAIIQAAKDSIGFKTSLIKETEGGNVGCAAAVSIIFTRATGRKIMSPESIIYNTPAKTSSELEYTTISLYNDLIKDTKNWKKRNSWENAQPGDIIITATRGKIAGHTGIIIDETIIVNGKQYYKIISNSSKGFQGSAPGTIQKNYNMYGWKNTVVSRNPKQSAAFEYIGPYKV